MGTGGGGGEDILEKIYKKQRLPRICSGQTMDPTKNQVAGLEV